MLIKCPIIWAHSPWPIKFEGINWAKLVLKPEDKLKFPIEEAWNFRLLAAISNNIIWITRNKFMNHQQREVLDPILLILKLNRNTLIMFLLGGDWRKKLHMKFTTSPHVKVNFDAAVREEKACIVAVVPRS